MNNSINNHNHSRGDVAPFTCTYDCDSSDPVISQSPLVDSDEEYDPRPYSLWISGWSAYVISKYEVGEDISICCGDLNEEELLTLGRSIRSTLKQQGVTL